MTLKEIFAWDEYQKNLGALNQRRGIALGTGQMAIHFVSDVEMRTMILRKYERAVGDRKFAIGVYRDIASRFKDYILTEQRFASPRYNLPTQQADSGLYRQRGGHNQEFYEAPHFSPTLVSTRRGLVGYDHNKMGLDLQDNSFLFTERDVIVGYLRREERLNVNLIRPDWSPHVTNFHVKDHLRAGDLAWRLPIDQPTELLVGAAKPISDK